jgi:hypothetical protein
MTKRPVGRPPKITYLTLIRLARYIQNNYTVSDACRNVRVSRMSFYRYLNNEPEFTEMIIDAYKGRSYIPMVFDSIIM